MRGQLTENLSGDQQHEKRKIKAEIKNLETSLENETGLDIKVIKEIHKNIFTSEKDSSKAPENILTFDRAKYLAARYPKKFEMTEIRSLKDIIASGDVDTSHLPKGFVAIGNKSGSDNTNIKTENAYTGGFTYTHPNATARALAASRGFAVPGGFATSPY